MSECLQPTEKIQFGTQMQIKPLIYLYKLANLCFFFTGSDWCIWCKRLVSEVFDKKEFKDWANKNIILLEVDFPKRSPQSEELKAQNSQLQRTFQGLIRGYPTGIFAQPVLKDKDVQFSVIGSEETGFSLGYVRGGAKTWILEANKRLTTKK